LNREAYFDNAKAILIFLVIIGHMMSKFIGDSHLIGSTYFFIYTFHMPAFVLISGYFSKKVYQPGYIRKIAKKLLIPYLILQTMYSMYYYFVFDDSISFSLFIPRWALWFLLSLFFWNILLYFFGKIKFGLPLAILISLLIGYVSEVNEVLSLSRTFFFFPFFLMGYHLEKKHFKKLKTRTNLTIGLILSIVIFAIVYKYIPLDFNVWLMEKRSYAEMSDLPSNIVWLARLCTYFVMAIATYMFLVLVPKRKVFFTSIGRVTMAIYLSHMAIVRIFYDSTLRDFIENSGQYWILIIGGISIVYLLSRKPFVKVMNKIAMGK